MTQHRTQVDYRTFTLHGTHYAMGKFLGELSPQFALPPWWAEPPAAAFAEACAREIALLHPPLLEEVQGYADGQGQPVEDFLRILCRKRLSGRITAIPERGGCTSFAWRTAQGHIMVGRNYDFHPVQSIRQRIHATPDSGYASIGMRGSVPVGRYDGVNEAGLFICLHVVLADAPRDPRPGVPFHLIPRLILETCASVQEALHSLTLLPHLHSFNYLVADADSFAAVEAHHDRLRIIYPEGDVLAVGNFYQHPQMAPLQGRRKQALSRQRVAFIQQQLARAGDADDAWAMVQGLLQDRSIPVCGTEGGHSTLWSCMADLTAQRLAYAAGNPTEVDYMPIPYP